MCVLSSKVDFLFKIMLFIYLNYALFCIFQSVGKKGVYLLSKNIVILSTDKGGATVVMNRHEYVNKMKVIQSDTQAYTRVQEDPTMEQITTLNKTIQKLAKNGVIAPNLKKVFRPC